MAKLVFFSIPAYGHTNPTLPLVQALTAAGHGVWYYSFEEFCVSIEAAGAVFVGCDDRLPPTPPDLDKKVGKDFAALIEMVTQTTLAMDTAVCRELETLQPDCVISDSVCFWGKLFAQKLGLPYLCSTTTFAFNKDTARLMRPGIGAMLKSIVGMPRINRCMAQLRQSGYPVQNFISILQNDNETDTIVYTSRLFQPLADTFSSRLAFIGPSLATVQPTPPLRGDPLVYVSLGTVLNHNDRFYRNCLEAFASQPVQAILSVGNRTDIAALGPLPANCTVQPRVNQLEVLQQAAAFLSHSGMNSVSESLYLGVPLALWPQHDEEAMVARRVVELGAGLLLRDISPKTLYRTVRQLLDTPHYRDQAAFIGQSFREAGGCEAGVQKILAVAEARQRS